MRHGWWPHTLKVPAAITTDHRMMAMMLSIGACYLLEKALHTSVIFEAISLTVHCRLAQVVWRGHWLAKGWLYHKL